MISRVFVVLVFTSLLFSCSPKSGATKSKGAAHSEDLSVYRPSYQVPGNDEAPDIETVEVGAPTTKPVNDVTSQINAALETQEANNSKQKVVQGYTVQVYSGNSREAANEARSLVYRTMPESRPETTYVQPNYKVKVGKYLSRMEAQKIFAKLKSDFPSALVVPEKIKLSQY